MPVPAVGTLSVEAPPVVPGREASGLSGGEINLHARLLAMVDSRRVDTLLIDEALGSASGHVRAVAARSIGQAGATSRSARLGALLDDPDPGVAADAAFSLGLLRDTAAVPALAGALGSGKGTVSREAAWSLGEMGEAARATVERALADTAGVRHVPELLRAAAKLRPVPVAVIAEHLDGVDSVRVAAAYALGRNRPPAAVRHLLRLAADPALAATEPDAAPELPPAVEILASAARGLAATAAGDSLRDEALAALGGLVRHPHPHVRINAIRSLGTFGPPGRTAMLSRASDSDPNVRIAVAQSVATVLGSTAPDWDRLWAADTGFAYRASLLASAAQGRSAGHVLRLGAPWADAGDWRHRSAYAGALAASRRGPRRDAALEAMRASPDPRVRAATLDALADTAGPPGWHRRLLEIAASDDDVYVRAGALGAAAARAGARELPAILAAYRKAIPDSINEARLAALSAVAAIWRRDSLAVSAEMRSRLASLAPPADALERAALRDIPVLAHWPGPEGTPRPIEWYEDRVRTFVEPHLAGKAATAEVTTERGTLVIELAGAIAPLTVDNFVTLANAGYYQGTRFHRVVPNFVAQDGDPRGDGNGGPGYAIRDELNRLHYQRGTIGMALSGPHTGGSQYFLTHSPQPHLDGHYTVFGRLVSGWPTLDAIVQGDAILRVHIR